ncbi:RDD family protein [Williamsia maris]|uniref:RDD family protein n=1 Tax=Williamsia maris TaxID=72806 RepID=A0ABT1H8L4_9NOCA|nr:RDD family protein [Williamsia maris]MCP2174597.1 RDD family protein [Williamsia maris]
MAGDAVVVDTDETTLCSNCSSELTPGAAFCTRCGSGVADRAVAPPSDAPEAVVTVAEPAAPSVDVDTRWAGLRPVGVGIRVLSFLLDLSALLVVGSATAALSIVVGVPAIATVIAPLAVVAVWIWNLSWLIVSGNSFGKAAVGVRAVGATTLDTPAALPAVLRSVLFGATAGIVSVTVLVDRTPWKRGWHDIASGIILVDALNGRNPLGPRPVASVLRRPERGLQTVAAPIPFSPTTPN